MWTKCPVVMAYDKEAHFCLQIGHCTKAGQTQWRGVHGTRLGGAAEDKRGPSSFRLGARGLWTVVKRGAQQQSDVISCAPGSMNSPEDTLFFLKITSVDSFLIQNQMQLEFSINIKPVIFLQYLVLFLVNGHLVFSRVFIVEICIPFTVYYEILFPWCGHWAHEGLSQP